MSSHEPGPDDEDTGPVPVGRAAPTSGAASQRRYDAPLSVNPRPVHKDRRPVVVAVAAAVAVVALVVLAWVFWPSSGPQDARAGQSSEPSESSESSGDAGPPSETTDEAAERLMGMLPPGYPPGTCEPVAPADEALAQVSCERNTDPGGPLTATFTVTADEQSLESAFDAVIDTLSVVDCPGNIQSPGPWRRNAAPEQAAGTLVCGFDRTTSTVAWTTDSQLMLSEVQSGPQGPNMVQLYSWWSSHS
ncbi:MAG: hypothetical protein SW019_10820 [Actinomycetota bacterium]|nr:hypothetical protein [Actinomycetota bacterium]